MKFAEIIFQKKTGPDKSTLTYEIPENLAIKAGQLVSVPLRKSKTSGLVWKIHNQKPTFKTVQIENIIYKKPLLTDDQIKLCNWLSQYYLCPIYKVLKLFIPKRVFDNKPVKSKPEQRKSSKKIAAKTLTGDQKNAISQIMGAQNTWLIHGITGSGKTEIYARLAEEYIKKGQQVLILVPEISLTPQIIEYFENALGVNATVIHSKISEGERYRAWQDIWHEKAKLVIGSRSAIFAPCKNLGLIIVDEEHEHSYKQENEPRYDVHKVATKMQQMRSFAAHPFKLIYGSATPSIETAEVMKEQTIYLKDRIGNSTLPLIEVVDLREEFKRGNHSIFSESLYQALQGILAKKEQAILFLNRRGTASSVICRDCGYTEKCPDCELPLTYHSRTHKNATLICHHCGKIKNPSIVCPVCKSAHIRFLGIGTQKIETELTKEFPDARVLRADKDTTGTKHGFRDIYKAFRDQKADILIGTQMIAKGLHLPKVNLVGVILADIGLNIPDFRSAERNFQLMTQVAGRAGRSGSNGQVIIQSYNPDHIALLCAQKQNYAKFFNYERTQRKLLNNPPFGRLVKIMVEDASLNVCRKRAEEIAEMLKQFSRTDAQADAQANSESDPKAKIQSDAGIEVNCYPAYISRLRGKYRYIVLLKSINLTADLHELLKNLPETVKIDVDPITVN